MWAGLGGFDVELPVHDGVAAGHACIPGQRAALRRRLVGVRHWKRGVNVKGNEHSHGGSCA